MPSLVGSEMCIRDRCTSTARVYTHFASPPWLVWLTPLWTNLDRNSSFSVSHLSEIPQTSVAQNRLSYSSRPCPCWTLAYSSGSCPPGLCPTAALPSALPDSDRPLSLLTSTSMLLMASNKTPGFPLSSVEIRFSAFPPQNFRAPRERTPSRTSWALWYQTSNVTKCVCKVKFWMS